MSEQRRIMIVHNRYQLRGGEDTVVDYDVALLRDRGHEVLLHEAENDATGLAAARGSVWNARAARELQRAARAFQPDLAHVHNHAYALSASIYPALAALDVPIVATLHNYRMTCSNAFLQRAGATCELCVGTRASWQGIRHRCFRGSVAGSVVHVGMQLAYRRSAMPAIDRWLTPSHAAREVFLRAEWPAEQLHVHENPVRDTLVGDASRPPEALFVGRLSPEKGIETLMRAWEQAPLPGRLRIIGEGPLAPKVTAWAAQRDEVDVVGRVDAELVQEGMRSARVVVVPSTWRETFGLVALEAFAAGTPVIASDIGALAETVAPETGWLVAPADPAALHTALTTALTDQSLAAERGQAARARYDEHYGAAAYAERLEGHHQSVCAARGA